jgi:hypothetical protein
MRLPPQIPPVYRDLPACQAYIKDTGAVAAQTPCDSLQGMARQMCYALEYGISA